MMLQAIDEYLHNKYSNYKMADNKYDHFSDRSVYWIYCGRNNEVIVVLPREAERDLITHFPPFCWDSSMFKLFHASDPELLNKIEKILSEKA